MKIFQWNSDVTENSPAINPEILVEKCLSVVEKLRFVQWDFSEPPGIFL